MFIVVKLLFVLSSVQPAGQVVSIQNSLFIFQIINLSRNSIRSMKGLQNHNLLQDIDLEENQVCSFQPVKQQ